MNGISFIKRRLTKQIIVTPSNSDIAFKYEPNFFKEINHQSNLLIAQTNLANH